MKVYRCERCGYEWGTRKPEKPRRCAGKECRSPYWDVARGTIILKKPLQVEKHEKAAEIVAKAYAVEHDPRCPCAVCQKRRARG